MASTIQDTPFYVAPEAFTRLTDMVSDDKSFLRVKVEEGGCAGLRYSFNIETDREDDDRVIANDGGPEVRIDPFSLVFLQDATLEFVREDFREFFSIKNPHATSVCGCGESYSI